MCRWRKNCRKSDENENNNNNKDKRNKRREVDSFVIV